jgi:hypothetical protein
VNLPDLRPEQNEVTLEHCSVLMERLYKTLHEIYNGDPDEFRMICDQIDPVTMKQDLMTVFTKEAFLRLFQTQFGKGVIVGAFVQRFLIDVEGEE